LHFADGDSARARRVVVAVGIGQFAYIPQELAGLPLDLVSHSSHHHTLDRFAGRDVAVIGAGASAIDIAALLQAAGANVTLIARKTQLAFQEPPSPMDRPRPLRQRLRWPRSGLGNGWKSTLCAEMPLAFRRLPESIRLGIVRKHLGPAPCWFTKEEIVGRVALRLGRLLERAQPEDTRVRLSLRDRHGVKEELLVEHVIAGTGFRPDLRRLAFLPEDMRRNLASVAHTPVLSSNFESSIEGMYFVGPITANTFGPLTRFAFGAGFASRRLVRALAG
jgi:cation diffusion facilitator CzcD-associated flavoprotein CzcO